MGGRGSDDPLYTAGSTWVMPVFSDVHAHLYYIPEEEIRRIPGEGLDFVLSAGEDLETSLKCVELARSHGFVYAAVGIHPSRAASATREELERTAGLLGEQEVVAVGEVGLDAKYVRLPSDWERQVRVFSHFLELAREHDLPLTIHSGRSFREVMDMVLQADVLPVFHWFSGPLSYALQAIEAGAYFSLGPAILHHDSYVPLVDVLPLDRILLETDTPVRFRGVEARPWWVKRVAERIAEIKNTDVGVIERKTRENALDVFGV